MMETPTRKIFDPDKRVFVTEKAERRVCIDCGREFWSWPNNESYQCARCLWEQGVIPKGEERYG